MKRYLSVFGLAARSSFWQGLALMIVSVALAAAGGKKATFCLCAAGTGQVYGVRRYAVRGAAGRLLYHLAVHNAGELLAVLRRDRPCWN